MRWGQLDDFSATRLVNFKRSVDPGRRPPRSTSSANRPILDAVTADLISSGVVVAHAVTIIDVDVVIADTYLGHAVIVDNLPDKDGNG